METINEIIAAVEEPPESFEQYLTSYADRVGDLVNSFIPKGTHADMDRYLYQPLMAYSQNGGKRHRPLICFAACRAVGGDMALSLIHIEMCIRDRLDDDAESIITSERYNAITHVIDKTMKRSHKGMTTTQKIDRVVTTRWLGLPIFVVVMALVYYLAISVGTGVVTDWANDGISGDGFLYTGGAAYEEAVGEWEGEQANIEAYLAAAEEDGIDVEGATAALEAEEPTAADESAIAAFQELSLIHI